VSTRRFWLTLQYKSGTTTEAESGEVAVSAEGDCRERDCQDLTENPTLARKPDGTRLQVQM
jgi:hypothetical protein